MGARTLIQGPLLMAIIQEVEDGTLLSDSGCRCKKKNRFAIWKVSDAH